MKLYENHRPDLIQKCVIGDYDAMAVGRSSLIVVSQSPDNGQEQQAISFPISAGSCTPEVLWRPPKPNPRSQTALTSTLPLELELIIQGYCKEGVNSMLKINSFLPQRMACYVDSRWLKWLGKWIRL